MNVRGLCHQLESKWPLLESIKTVGPLLIISGTQVFVLTLSNEQMRYFLLPLNLVNHNESVLSSSKMLIVSLGRGWFPYKSITEPMGFSESGSKSMGECLSMRGDNLENYVTDGFCRPRSFSRT